MIESAVDPSSFRDPSGFIFWRDGRPFRQVNLEARPDYDRLIESGLYAELVDAGLLVAHEEVDDAPHTPSLAYKVLRPDPIPFVAYPYEWCFGQLKAAATATLEIQRRAVARGMSLKDATGFNVQFRGWRPVFIDTLSFESYREGSPWVAYRQFCQHFLAPLALMSRVDPGLNQLLRTNLDGVPLALAARLLPRRTWLNPGLLLHIHLHARAKQAFDQHAEKPKERPFPRTALLGMLDSLGSTVKGLRWEPSGTEWADYYTDTNYTDAALAEKERLVGAFLDRVAPRTAWDLGANNGRFSRLASARGAATVAFDVDPAAVERNYREATRLGEEGLLPLVLDLTNPSPGLGWANRERLTIRDRGPADVVLALALVHHLAIGNNVPLPKVAELFADLGRNLIIEFVPKSDSQVRRLLVVREDIFPGYTREGFEAAFAGHFSTEAVEPIAGTERTLYLLRRRER
ncbi:MAG TPA: SAM-dependent methyltransferase [Isosphaeraceae bacterium]